MLGCFMILYDFFDGTGGGGEVYEHQLMTYLCYFPSIVLCLIKLGAQNTPKLYYLLFINSCGSVS